MAAIGRWLLRVKDGENPLPGAMVMRSMPLLVFSGSVTLVIFVSHGPVFAEGGSRKGEMAEMGERFGKFMGSFMQEAGRSGMGRETGTSEGRDAGSPGRSGYDGRNYDYQQGERPGEKPGERRPSSVDDRELRYGASRRYPPVPTYDPWGASPWSRWDSVPVIDHDPWVSSSTFADWDWARRKRYYGSGVVGPWELPGPGWSGTHEPYWRGGGGYDPGYYPGGPDGSTGWRDDGTAYGRDNDPVEGRGYPPPGYGDW